MAGAVPKYDVPTPDASIQSILDALDDWPPSAAATAEVVRDAFAFVTKPDSWRDRDGVPNQAKLRTALNAAKTKSRTALPKVLDADLSDARTDARTLKFPVLLVLSTVHICATAALVTFNAPGTKRAAPAEAARTSHPELTESCERLTEAPVAVSIGTRPVRVGDPFVEAFERWLSQAFSAVLKVYEITPVAADWKTATIEAFEAYFWGESREAAALRDFLIVGNAKEPERLREIGALRTLETALVAWIRTAETADRHRLEAWQRHIQQTKDLPDGRGTMFNESFGVRKVFQPPLVRYHIQGRRPAEEAETIADVGGLFGGLVSDRVSSQDLVIVSGGPGSGKSTLCRVLASRMAAVPGLHPVFLRLRKAKDGSDIRLFVEESLKEKGLIDRIADLYEIPNLVLILDGFDELAMSSRSRLRRFFNILRDELREGPLGHARVIVSGRDTLFPAGEGLPSGSHIIALQPFDRDRVAAWGTMWRRQHRSGPGHSFHPEQLMREDAHRSPGEHPLTHLVRWPLTLHLIAQIHTAGRLIVSSDQTIEKSYLYRSILKETAARQEEQTDGEGRMDAARLRDFLRNLAWEMYLRQTDSMDPVDVEPLLQELYRDKPETDRAELAEVAVVNAPELTKADETGFEFVHKSFSEFLVAEHLAALVEPVIQKVPNWTGELTWRIDENAAADLLAPALAFRPLPQEIQEMLEPMLGVLVAFRKGDEVGDDIEAGQRRDGLTRIIERFERLYVAYVSGNALDVVTLKTREHNPLEAYAHYGLGIVVIGAASARRLKDLDGAEDPRYFRLDNGTGMVNRFLSILQAGGTVLDYSTSHRLFSGSTIRSQSNPEARWNERNFPAISRYFGLFDGYSAAIPDLGISAAEQHVILMIESLLNDAHSTHRSRRSERYPAIDSAEALFGLLRLLQEIGLAADWGPDELVYIAREIEYLRHVFVESGGDRRNLFMRLSHLAEDLRFRSSSRFGRKFHYRLSRILEEERYRIDYSLRLDPRAHPEQPD